MLINPNIVDKLCEEAGQSKTQKAIEYKDENKIKVLETNIENQNTFEIKAIAKGSEAYRTYIAIKDGEVEDVSCQCVDYYNHYSVCKHTLASVLQCQEECEKRDNDENETSAVSMDSEILENVIERSKDQKIGHRNFKQIVNIFYNEEIENIDEDIKEIKTKGTIKLEPKIYYDKFANEMKVEFKIGNRKMYKIKDLSEFYTRMINKEYYKYGEKLEFVHTKEVFEDESKPLLDFLMKYAEIIKYANSNANSNYRYYGKALNENNIILGNSGIDDIFDVLKNKKVEFQKDYKKDFIEFTEDEPKIEFKLKKMSNSEYAIIPNIEIFNISLIRGKNYKYILEENKLHRCTKEFEASNLKLLELFRKNYITELTLGKEDLSQLFSIIIPKVKNAVKLEGIDEKEIEQYKPKKLAVKVFLDFNEKNYIIADVKFCYENYEFNPLDSKEQVKIPRNMIAEAKALNMFRKTGFMLEPKNLRFILPDDDKIYQFLSNDITYYMQKFEVLVTDNFKTKEIRQPKLGTIGIKIENDLLSIDLSNIDINPDEIEVLMEKYKLKKKYHRLKDGSFIDLEQNKEMDFLDKLVTGMDLDYKDIEKGPIRLPVHRSLYLNQLLKGIKGTEIIKNDDYREIVNNLNKDQIEDIKVPEKLDKILRYYQKTGFKWLKVLDTYKFGGILADDMGLGKTIQMLSVIVDYVEKYKNYDLNLDEIEKQKYENQKNIESIQEQKRASLVVSPSSLTLNWENEAKKFADELKVLVIRGTLAERKRQIDDLQNYDLVITSYDLLKRDIDLYNEKNYKFRFIIADEAQYLKNSNTQNAKTIKQIKADTRYALTGTPIENSLSELWSIFDYIMPGYLFTYKKFKAMYETPIIKDNDEKAMEKLKMLIEPFVLRRNKKEVLKELPEKTVTVLNNEMGEEQRNIYISYLAQAKEEISEQIDINGFERSQMKILAALTRLRQICCHPSLFIDNYNDGSSKLDQCVEIIEDATQGGHKILLFSGYTSMFPIIQKELEKRGIKYFKLTGSTKVDERIEMVDEFNENPQIKVFLISLKAGGTGLNLTGADMVIHYDPWWNISTENQATDRAYRIGQKNNVQVYKLITKNSIEEKIYELQQKKAQLIDNVLSTKTSFINKLSKDEIMSLFD